MALRPIASAAGFFLTRHWQRTAIGPYVVTTAEVRRDVFETSVTWGDEGPEVSVFGSGKSFDQGSAEETHTALSTVIERAVGLPAVADFPPPAA
jgi:hypothetical protein